MRVCVKNKFREKMGGGGLSENETNKNFQIIFFSIQLHQLKCDFI